MSDDNVSATCFRKDGDRAQQNAEMLVDYENFMSGTPSDDLVARLAAYNAAHPEARIAARAWLADRLGRATDTGLFTP
jgi:hypothetical protein